MCGLSKALAAVSGYYNNTFLLLTRAHGKNLGEQKLKMYQSLIFAWLLSHLEIHPLQIIVKSIILCKPKKGLYYSSAGCLQEAGVPLEYKLNILTNLSKRN